MEEGLHILGDLLPSGVANDCVGCTDLFCKCFDCLGDVAAFSHRHHIDETLVGDKELDTLVATRGNACLGSGEEGVHEKVLVHSSVSQHPIVGAEVAR